MDEQDNTTSSGCCHSFQEETTSYQMSKECYFEDGDDLPPASGQFGFGDKEQEYESVTNKNQDQEPSLASLMLNIVHWLQLLRLTSALTWLSFVVTVELERRFVNTQLEKDIVLYYQTAVLVHEVGHALVMVMLGVEFYPIIFVPFAGAFVMSKSFTDNVYDEALIAAGGPILGTLAAALMAVVGRGFKSPVLKGAGIASLQGNLINLDSWGALDGARILQVVSPLLAIFSTLHFVITRGVFLSADDAIRLLIGTRRTFYRLWGHHEDNKEDGLPVGEFYYYLPWTRRLGVAVFYGALLVGVVLVSDGCQDKSEPAFYVLCWYIVCCLFFEYIRRLALSRRDVFEFIEILPKVENPDSDSSSSKSDEPELVGLDEVVKDKAE